MFATLAWCHQDEAEIPEMMEEEEPLADADAGAANHVDAALTVTTAANSGPRGCCPPRQHREH
jgi:phosphatidylethanolamine-binding protein (PEBP) family uncharacterized protein